MFEFNIVVNDVTSERAYYVNNVRFDRSVWRACMEVEILTLKKTADVVTEIIKGYDITIKAAQGMMDGKATFSLSSDYRAFYRQVVSEVRAYQREEKSNLDTIQAEIEDLTDKLED